MSATSPERAAYEAGRWPDVIPWEEASFEVRERHRAIVRAVIKASPELAGALKAVNGLRAMISARQAAIADAGISHGLAPDFHEATFTASEILAAIGDAPEAARG